MNRKEVIYSLFHDCLIKDERSDDELYESISKFPKQNIILKYHSNIDWGKFFYKDAELFYFQRNYNYQNNNNYENWYYLMNIDNTICDINNFDYDILDNVFLNKFSLSEKEKILICNCFELVIKKQEERMIIKMEKELKNEKELDEKNKKEREKRIKLYNEVLNNSFDI